MKSQRFLVTGLKALDAGKTTVARAVLLYLRDREINACGFKLERKTILYARSALQ